MELAASTHTYDTIVEGGNEFGLGGVNGSNESTRRFVLTQPDPAETAMMVDVNIKYIFILFTGLCKKFENLKKTVGAGRCGRENSICSKGAEFIFLLF